ncbi:hypothetical protein ACOZ4L_13095 [Haloplanus ruber]|uniref:Uncharacterized protein n=1 Tax=Haloplanus ruber TaxID=869892 RepID=A0ABD6D0C2_9EURY|nr:hypothetical protein [Haloplanus ruber]
MASQTQSPDRPFGTLLRLLVTYRLFIYLGGLIAIGIPLLLQRAYGTELSPGARTAIVAVSLGLMIVTYLGERRVGRDHVDATGESAETYSLRLRASIATAVVGLAIGIYVAMEVNPLTGSFFVLGAFLFAYMGYRTELGDANGV